jgi:ABC-type lipoprotein release transport system permease subunit
LGRVLLVGRLAARDLRRRPAEAMLLLLAILAATTTLTLGLLLRGVTSHPFAQTRAATAGPDVVGQADPAPVGDAPADRAALERLAHARGVSGHSGPYAIAQTTLAAHGGQAAVLVEGRDVAFAAIDQPKPTAGHWVSDGGVVVERSFADAFDVHVGDRVSVNGRRLRVVGIAVTAAMAPYPELGSMKSSGRDARGGEVRPGLVWVTRADARRIAPDPRSRSYVINLRLADPAAAPAFVDQRLPSENAPMGTPPTGPPPVLLDSWQQLADASASLVRNERRALLTCSWLLALLALASVAVLVGGRMADQLRRVGLLKAVGATPRLVASVLLAEYVVVALLAAAAGLGLGRLLAPLLTKPSAGLVGSAGAPPLGLATIVLVAAVALGVAVVATFVPALRASRTSTVLALADAARPPRRSARLIAISARLPVPLLLGLRIAARRPRRSALFVVSIAITVTGIVTAIAAQAQLQSQRASGSGLADPRFDRLSQVLLVITIMLIAQAAVNAIFVTWATVLDARHTAALARALGATPRQVAAGLSAAQVLPALAGALLGIPGGLALFTALSDDDTPSPSLWWLVVAVVGSVLVVAGLTAIPARLSARRPVAEVLQAELA